MWVRKQYTYILFTENWSNVAATVHVPYMNSCRKWGENAWKKKRKKKKEKENAAAETQEMRTQTHTYNHCQSAAHNHINHHKSYLDAHQRRIHSTPPKPHGQHLPHGVCMREMNKKVINFFIIKSYPKFRLVMIF